MQRKGRGWISIYRDIQENWLWEIKPFSYGQAWIDLLLSVNHKEQKVLINSDFIAVKKGEMITSQVKLGGKWGWDRKKVKKFLDLLKEDSMITYEATNHFTLVKVLNYDVYQDDDLEARGSVLPNDKDSTRPTPPHHLPQQLPTNNNENNDNNDNKEILYGEDSDSPYQGIIDAWNELGLQSLRTISNQRAKLLSARLKEHGEDSIYEAMDRIRASSFLKGQNKTGWTISFDWLVRPNNYIKVLEGNYEDKNKARSEKTETEKYFDMLDEWAREGI